MGFTRPTRSVTLATVVAGALAAAAGFLIGNRSEEHTVPAVVPLVAAKSSTGGKAIVVPTRVDLPNP